MSSQEHTEKKQNDAFKKTENTQIISKEVTNTEDDDTPENNNMDWWEEHIIYIYNP